MTESRAPAGDLRRPRLDTEEGRLQAIRYLNDHLPTKRLIGQGLLRNERGEVLLCELTYKQEWDLPGGVVDPGESPATCVEREIAEELGMDVRAGDLLVVDWLPPYRGWDDALLLVYDLGVVPSAAVDEAELLTREIRAVHWCPPEGIAGRVAPYAARMLAAALRGGPTCYLEDSVPREQGAER